MVFTPKSIRLSMPDVFDNTATIMYSKSINTYLRFYFNSKYDYDEDILKHMRMLYARTNRIVSLFNH